MVLTGARRAAGSRLGHVDLVDRREIGGGVPGQQAGEPWGEGGADHDGAAPFGRLGVEVEQPGHLVDVVGDRDDVGTSLDGDLGQSAVLARGQGEDEDGARIVERFVGPRRHPRRRSQRRRHPVGPGAIRIDQDQIGQADDGLELSSGASAHGAAAGDNDPHPSQRSSGPLSSRQPPFWGGTPPVPRKRNTPATTPAVNRATTARRRALTGRIGSSEWG